MNFGVSSTDPFCPACQNHNVPVLAFHRVPTVPVKNLNGSSPVNPALAGKRDPGLPLLGAEKESSKVGSEQFIKEKELK